MSLASFSPRVREWFEQAFAAPTPAQAQAWPAIARGEHVLVSAPTGSGKTLAAFLWALDRLSSASSPKGDRSRRGGVRVVYVSPLKALAYDIERNLRAPLRGIGAASSPAGEGERSPDGDGREEVRVGIRTGDTPQRERAAMVRNPPDILVTTPESLYLILTSNAREMLNTVEAVIVDEIHAVAHSKRGSHLALTLERLQAHVRSHRPAGGAGGPPADIQRIGLSATQNPLEEIGRFLVGPHRRVNIVDAGVRKQLDLRIEVPVESMAEPDRASGPSPAVGAEPDPLASGPPPAGESTGGSPLPASSPQAERGIWPAIYPELLTLVREHTSTIIFVNNRRSAERVALRLNELAAQEQENDDEKAASGGRAESRGGDTPPGEVTGAVAREIARAHHGSLAREERTKVEELLKAGQLPCLVATSSLELGIDMGAVDLVLQIESPKSVARGLQRIGRAGHGVDQVSRGRIFPKFRGDLLECAVVARRMHEGLIEPTVVPRNALDVLAQQIVAIAASSPEGDTRGSRDARTSARRRGAAAVDEAADGAPGDSGISVEDLYALVTSTHSYSTLSRALFENVLDMLDGRYPSREFGELRARIVWDRLAGSIRARKGSRQLAIANAGTIPDRGLYAVTLPDGRRVGELDEEMVYEARPGQAFLLGASTWRIEEIGRDRVIVTPAPGAPGAVPFWKGDSVGRPVELGRAIGAFSRWAVEQEPHTLQRDYDLDERAARNLIAYLREQQSATRVLPSERTIVLERFRDEIGDWRLCLLSPYGRRVHAAWGLALSARIRERFGLDADVISSDDGIVMHLPDLDADDADALPSAAELVLLEPDEVEDAVTAELGGSALFGARFRENASRALLIPRAYPGRRTPLWQQRLKAQNLLEVAHRYQDFPIVLETYRECLQDVLDLGGLETLLRGLHTREISLVEVETPTASPFASSLLFDYVATYMYEGDTPSAERRAAALSLDRDLLRELLGQEELRELIDPGALARLEDDLQHRSDMTRATGRDGLHDVLRGVGDLNAFEVAQRVFAGVDADGLLTELVRERRAISVRLGDEQRWIAADDAALYRDALGAMPPGGLPEAFLADVPDALREVVARYARTHGPFTLDELTVRYRIDTSSVLRELERAGGLVRGELRPGGSDREWCDVEVLRRLRRASLAALRKEIEPADQRRLAAFLPSWQGVDRHSGAGAGVDRLREVLVPLQGLALPVEIWEHDVLPRRTGAYSQSWLDSLCASGEVVWVGAGASGRSGRVALYFREDAPAIGPPPAPSAARGGATAPDSTEHGLLRARLAQGPSFFTDLLELDAPAEALREALWDLVWAGEVTNDAWAPLRAPRLSLARGGGSDGRHRAPAGLHAGQASVGRSARSRFAGRRRSGSQSQVQGRWSLTDAVFRGGLEGPAGAVERRRVLAELLLERYGIVTREQVLAEGVKGGFAMLYDTFAKLETLGICRRGYFIEGMGGAQFALPGAVERLRAGPSAVAAGASLGAGAGASAGAVGKARTLVLAAADPAQPYGAALPWPHRPKRDRQDRRPPRVAGAYVVLVADEPVLYLERGGRGLLTLASSAPEGDATGAGSVAGGEPHPTRAALAALAQAVRSGRLGKLALERIDGQPAIASSLAGALVELGFHPGPRRLTLTA
ncbi:MAG TPA: DEAD/DEAH box helicase [Solirubrobacteraceae bacterium]|nr:DEAD/DEAH box helicase [Solirubrobacteraceae bacterium]